MSVPKQSPRLPGHGLTFGLVAVAALLLTAVFGLHLVPFWPGMAASVGTLAALALAVDGGALLPQLRPRPSDPAWGLASAAVLYAIFAAGDRISALIFPFARGQVESIYGLAGGGSRVAIALLLVLVLGPGEEIFWRGFVQRRLMARLGPYAGLIAATVLYAGVHVVSGNVMLVLSALVAGAFWGLMYVRVRRLWPLVISHVVWDVAVFLLLPLH